MYNFQVGDKFYWNGNYDRASYKEAIAEVVKVYNNKVYWVWYIDGKKNFQNNGSISTMTNSVESGKWVPLQSQKEVVEFNDPEYESMII